MMLVVATLRTMPAKKHARSPFHEREADQHTEALEAKIAELEQFAGRLALGNQVLEKALGRAQSPGGAL